MPKKIQNWAFIAPRMSRDLSDYFAGILEYTKTRPDIFIHSYLFSDADLSALTEMDGIISYAVPPPFLWNVFQSSGRPRPPMVAITLCKPNDTSIAYAHIDPDGVAERVFSLLKRRHCRSYAFCSNHAAFYIDESAALLSAFRRVVYAETGRMPTLFRPISTHNPNLIPSEIERFVKWAARQITPCGVFVHDDNVARKMLDTCRLKDIHVPEHLRVVGTGNSAVFCEHTHPPLSSYAVNHAKTGYAAASSLMRMIDDGWTARRASFEVPLTDVYERGSTLDERGSARFAQAAIDHIRSELDDGHAPAIRDIAFRLNISRRKIEKDFFGTFGHTIHDEIATYRLELLSRRLKSTTDPVGQIALGTGFGTITQANRAFKAKFGMTMLEYRRSH